MAIAPSVLGYKPKRWNVAGLPPDSLIEAVADVHQLKVRLLWNRGVADPEAIRRHYEPSLADLHDPFLMPAMAAAVERLKVAAAKQELVVIYGDFDADGVTGSAILQRAFDGIGARTRSYIPKRLEEGYGLNTAAVELLAAEGARVIVTVDCGIGSHAEIAQARALGIDTIVCDHHKLPAELPPALALLHPQLGDYPFPQLCAAGVCFKLAQALGRADELLDFAAVGTLADMVPLLGENRVLAKHGLDKLRRNPSLGLAAMMDLAAIDPARLSCNDVSFTLAPHINASGRLDDAGLAYRLMVTRDEAEAADLAERLRTLNEERQRLTRQVLAQAREQVRAHDAEDLAHVVGGEGWPPGVVGLVAGKLVEDTGKPAFVMELGDELCRGSARGVAGFDLVEALTTCKDMLARYGGHPRAAGFTLKRAAYAQFGAAIVRFAGVTLSELDLNPTIEIDSELKMRHLTWDIHRLTQEVGPFGVGNPTPTFMVRNLRPVDVRCTPRDHLRLKFKGRDGETLDAFGFGLGACAEWLGDTEVDVAFELGSTRFHGYESLELRVRDIRPSTHDSQLMARDS
ncbi:MAG: single-stranded-DNA-specific exonuclease RecJ [Chloroflexi bacterium]|nr:single-stranded-DNA-specific exonuclease RecJ [Chloroflexota bacterium]